MEKFELIQATINEEIDAMKGNVDQLLESMVALAKKEDDPQIVADARNIGSTSRQRLELLDP